MHVLILFHIPNYCCFLDFLVKIVTDKENTKKIRRISLALPWLWPGLAWAWPGPGLPKASQLKISK